MLAQLLVSGLAMGGIYALVALGFILIWQAVGVVSFAQGEFVMLGGFMLFTSQILAGLPAWAAILPSVLLMGAWGWIFEVVAYHPLRNASPLAVIISTIGVSVALKNLARIVWGPAPLSVPAAIPIETIHLGSLRLNAQNLLILACSAALVAAVHLLFEYTTVGRMMQATAQDRSAALLMGIPVRLMVILTFALSSVLAGLAGLLLAPVFFVSTTMGSMVTLKAFAATVVGGFGSVKGAVLGGLFIGLTEILGASFISSTYKDAFAFLILIAVLLIRPQGFLGEKIAEKV